MNQPFPLLAKSDIYVLCDQFENARTDEMVEHIAKGGKIVFNLGSYYPCIHWQKDHVYYRANGPAYQSVNFNAWYGKNNQRIHCQTRTTSKWFKNGELHRIDGPAYVSVAGREEWFRKGKHHRIDGPAVIMTNGAKKWFVSGKLHRECGPAWIGKDGEERFYLHGKRVEFLIKPDQDLISAVSFKA